MIPAFLLPIDHRVRRDHGGDSDTLMGLLGLLGRGSIYTEGNNADVNPLEKTYVSLQRQCSEYFVIDKGPYQSDQTLGINNQLSLSRMCQQVLMLVVPVPPHLRAPGVQGGHVESRRP